MSLEADPKQYGNYIISGGAWYSVGGTSDAAPQWAGFFAELNQKKGGSGVGHPGGCIYQLCGTAAYHDITSGCNGDYVAGPGYDLTTVVGTIEADTFLVAY
jgi:kumamolisin